MFIFTVNIAFNILFKMSLCVYYLFMYTVYMIYVFMWYIVIFCCVRTAAEYLRAEAALLCWNKKALVSVSLWWLWFGSDPGMFLLHDFDLCVLCSSPIKWLPSGLCASPARANRAHTTCKESVSNLGKNIFKWYRIIPTNKCNPKNKPTLKII